MAKINVLDREVGVIVENDEDYICITDIARYKNAGNTDDLIRSWLRNRNTVEFLGIWEQLNNPDFNPVQFDGFRKKTGRPQQFYSYAETMDRDDTRPGDCC